MSSESPVPSFSLDHPPVSGLPRRVVAGFWRRIFAFLVDTLVTAIPCAFFGFTFYRFFAHSKVAGDFLGFSITLPYFAILGSCVGGGQTLGHRLVRIRVADREGRCLSLGRSFLRYAILLATFQLSEAMIPVRAPADLKIFVSWMLPVLQIVIVYLYLFNVRTRQSLHDLAAGAYVVDADAQVAIETERFWRWHWAILSGVLLAGAVLTIAIAGATLGRGLLGDLISVQRAVLDSGKVRATTVHYSKTLTRAGSETTLQVSVNWNERPRDIEHASTEIAAIVLKAYPNANQLDYISVGSTEGFKVGFMNFSRNWVVRHRPSDWATKIQQLQSG